MKNFILIIAYGFISFLYPQDSSLQILPEGNNTERYITVNPGLDFLSVFEDTMFQDDIEKHTICKIDFDFNFDGIKDIALTDYYLWGAHIGPWEIYIGIENNKYSFVGDLWFHNDAVRFDSLSKGKSKVIVFDKAGGDKVDIVEYILSREGINQTKRNTKQLDSFEEMNDVFKEFRFQTMKESCISVIEYIKNKKIEWK
jgi:hypothetical protein